MSPRHLAVSLDARDPAGLGGFWGRLLGRDAAEDATGVLLPGAGTQIDLRFVAGDSRKAGQNHIHLHLTSSTLDDQQRVVAAALALGARHVDVGQQADEEHVVLADPEGNELCVIEPGNAFLAGCGSLAEVACEGSRDAGLFWSRATGWPLVWDRDQETAIQLPDGGTKVAWGGPPLPAQELRSRQRLELGVPAEEFTAAVDRLVTLGAVRRGDGPGGVVVLSDPDGTLFHVRAG